MIGPAQVVELGDLSDDSVLCLIGDSKLPGYELLVVALDRNELDFDLHAVLFEGEALADIRRPVLITLDLAMLLGLREVDDQAGVLLQDHPPEVLFRLRQGALSGDEGLVVALYRRVYEVGIDVRVRNVCCSLGQPHTGVFERL